MPAAVDHAAYRIVQEALTNVVRHAGDSSVSVELTLAGSELQILVSDDGPRVDEGDLQPGNGISGMRERATAVGGRLDVRPGAPDTPGGGGGTVVEAILPITIPAASE